MTKNRKIVARNPLCPPYFFYFNDFFFFAIIKELRRKSGFLAKNDIYRRFLKMSFNNKTYDILKWICLIFLPALAVFYSAIDSVFCWGHTAAVTTIISAIAAFVGSMIGISTKHYNEECSDVEQP